MGASAGGGAGSAPGSPSASGADGGQGQGQGTSGGSQSSRQQKRDQLRKNREDGRRREQEVKKDLEKKNPNSSVQSEQYLRDKDDKIVKDKMTGEARRIDHVVIKDGKVVKTVEVTSPTVDKTGQIAKEMRIREQGGNFIRDRETGNLVSLGDSPASSVVKIP